MNREHFFTELKIQLKKIALPATEKLDIIERYEEKYDQKISDGLTEEEASKELGSPKKIIKKIIDDLQLDYQEPTTPTNGWQEFTHNNYAYGNYDPNIERHPSVFTRFMQVLGLLCLNGLLMIWVFLTFYLLAFSGWILAGSFAASPLLMVIDVIFQGADPFKFFFSLALCGVGIIGILIMIPLTYFLWKVTKQYVKWNLNVLRGAY